MLSTRWNSLLKDQCKFNNTYLVYSWIFNEEQETRLPPYESEELTMKRGLAMAVY